MATRSPAAARTSAGVPGLDGIGTGATCPGPLSRGQPRPGDLRGRPSHAPTNHRCLRRDADHPQSATTYGPATLRVTKSPTVNPSSDDPQPRHCTRPRAVALEPPWLSRRKCYCSKARFRKRLCTMPRCERRVPRRQSRPNMWAKHAPAGYPDCRLLRPGSGAMSPFFRFQLALLASRQFTAANFAIDELTDPAPTGFFLAAPLAPSNPSSMVAASDRPSRARGCAATCRRWLWTKPQGRSCRRRPRRTAES